MTLNPPAEYGQTGLGITSFSIKSGTSQLHGSVYEYLRNDALDARGFFAPTTPINKQNEFGATAGGPIRKDKTFSSAGITDSVSPNRPAMTLIPFPLRP